MIAVPLVAGLVGSALALAPGPASAAVATASTACVATDHRLIGLSGLIATRTGYVAISDSNFDKSKIRIYYLDRACRFIRSIGYPTPAYDPEDLAVGRDGTLYVADIGDNDATRKSIAIWRLAPGSHTPRIYRYTYPDHPYDAEALLLAVDDSPIVVTKDIGNIYVPTRPASSDGSPTPLRKVGSFTPSAPYTPNGLGLAGGLLITGGANSADRTKVALRTYSTLFEWRVPDGDVVKAITTMQPAVTPLPNEPQGESIAYSLDGRHLFTISDQETEPVKTPILEYASGLGAASPSPHRVAPDGSAVSQAARGGPRLALEIGAIVGALLILMGVAGYVTARRRSL
jgi:hypothetical protein